MSDEVPFSVGEQAPASSRSAGAQLQSPTVPPGMKFGEREREVFEHICTSLREAGIEHLTAGMPIAVIVRTYCDWLDALAKCQDPNFGRVQKAQSGWYSPTPWADDEKRLKMELGQWLPKACLTIPSLTRVRKESGAATGQDDLFADLVGHATSSRPNGLPN